MEKGQQTFLLVVVHSRSDTFYIAQWAPSLRDGVDERMRSSNGGGFADGVETDNAEERNMGGARISTKRSHGQKFQKEAGVLPHPSTFFSPLVCNPNATLHFF